MFRSKQEIKDKLSKLKGETKKYRQSEFEKMTRSEKDRLLLQLLQKEGLIEEK